MAPEHPHGLSDVDFDEIFTKDKAAIFACHACPWLIHRLAYRRTDHDNFHVRGYKRRPVDWRQPSFARGHSA